MLRNPVRTLLLVCVILGGALLLPFPGGAQSYVSTCPEMTDSITRLYQAYFGRDPDASGFRHWTGLYQTGEYSLAEISESFANSSEFGTKRTMSNQEFVDWTYELVVGPNANQARKDYWVDALDSGYPRGSMVLAFTESREWVARTGTTVPLAGYLRWYPKGSHWYCDVGTVTRTVEPLVGTEVWADYHLHNRGAATDHIEVWTLEGDNSPNVPMVRTDLAPGFTEYDWDGVFSGDGDYGRGIQVQAGPTTTWIVVFYPRSLGPERLGWQLG